MKFDLSVQSARIQGTFLESQSLVVLAYLQAFLLLLLSNQQAEQFFHLKKLAAFRTLLSRDYIFGCSLLFSTFKYELGYSVTNQCSKTKTTFLVSKAAQCFLASISRFEE
jgi:hypothetical protein